MLFNFLLLKNPWEHEKHGVWLPPTKLGKAAYYAYYESSHERRVLKAEVYSTSFEKCALLNSSKVHIGFAVSPSPVAPPPRAVLFRPAIHNYSR